MKNKMGGICNTYEGQESALAEKTEEMRQLEKLGVDGKILLKRISKKLDGAGGMN
jgi:hypothetical protein